MTNNHPPGQRDDAEHDRSDTRSDTRDRGDRHGRDHDRLAARHPGSAPPHADHDERRRSWLNTAGERKR